MAQIFISYKRVNKDKVFSLVSEIEKKVGCKCWVDLDGIESSAQFASVICRAIDNAEVVLFMHSSVHLSIDFESDWTIKELNYAQMKKKRVVLVKLDNAPLDNIFLMEYGSKNNIDSQDSTQFEKLLKDLRSWVGVASTVQPVQKPLAYVTAEEKKLCDEYVELVRRDSYSLRDGVLSGKVLKLAQQGKTEAEYAYGFGLACHGIDNLKNLYPDLLAARYKLGEPETFVEMGDYDLLCYIGKKRGFLISGGEVDYLRTARMLLDEFRDGRIGRITLD